MFFPLNLKNTIKVNIIQAAYLLDFKTYPVDTTLEITPLTSTYLKRAKDWIQKFSQCNNLQQNEELQTEVRHLISLCSKLLPLHYNCPVRNNYFYEDFESYYYFRIDRSQSMRQMIGFDRNRIYIFYRKVNLNWWMLNNYALEEVAESVIVRLIYLINQLTGQCYDLRTKEGFDEAFLALLLYIFAKGYDEELVKEYKKQYLEYFLPLNIVDLNKKMLTFSKEIQAQTNEKLQNLLSRIDEQKLQINRVCPITLEEPALNKLCVVLINNEIAQFYNAYALLKHFINQLNIKYMNKDILCPLRNSITKIKFLSLNDFIELLEKNIPKSLEKMKKIDC